jgi:hypothetical protein
MKECAIFLSAFLGDENFYKLIMRPLSSSPSRYLCNPKPFYFTAKMFFDKNYCYITYTLKKYYYSVNSLMPTFFTYNAQEKIKNSPLY